MKHLTKVGRSSKLIQRKFVRVGEGTLIYNIGRNRFIEMARAAGAVYKVGDSKGSKVLIRLDVFDEYMEQFREKPVEMKHGGLDKALVDFFGEQLQANVQRVIQKEFLGEQPVGTCATIDIPGYNKKVLHTPTMRIPQPILDPRIIYTATRSTLVEAIKKQISTITLPAFGHLTGNVKSEIVAKYMRMAYDDIKNTLECQSYANKWGDIYKNKNIDDVMFRDYFDRKSE